MTPIFYHNMVNGFSGVLVYDSYYYALFRVSMTNIAQWIQMVFECDVDYDFEKYGKEIKKANPEKLSKYDPTKWDWTKITWPDRTQFMEERGISLNDDGSTNNLPEYFWYCREC